MPQQPQSLEVFVYGTLKPGEVNHWVCAQWVVEARPAIAQGDLYALPLGYPAIASGNRSVHGYVLSFANPAILSVLDRFEQHDPAEFARRVPGQSLEQNQYQRQKIQVTILPDNIPQLTWAYLMNSSQIRRLGGLPLTDGQWNHQKQKAAFRRD